eukprot:675144-Pleurochrysis_carterae.AAC.13
MAALQVPRARGVYSECAPTGSLQARRRVLLSCGGGCARSERIADSLKLFSVKTLHALSVWVHFVWDDTHAQSELLSRLGNEHGSEDVQERAAAAAAATAATTGALAIAAAVAIAAAEVADAAPAEAVTAAVIAAAVAGAAAAALMLALALVFQGDGFQSPADYTTSLVLKSGHYATLAMSIEARTARIRMSFAVVRMQSA